ncbi:hypothetical protein [uncultured Jatrophihabitans sp.]|uniref:hypothetical protein n=1 Tax=uncultured Jatrophihabitans sp. TaxID=1610747 RepID=UPI0035CC2D30
MTEYSPPSYDRPVAGGASTPNQSSTQPSAKDQAADAAQAGKQAAGEVAQTATTAAKDVAQETASQAKQLAGKTGQQVREQAGVQKDALVGGLRSLVDQLTEMTDGAHTEGIAVEFAGQARDRARSAAEWLDSRDPDEVVDGVRSLGRRRPGAYLTGSLVAGLLAGRLTRGVAAVHTDDTPAGPRSDDTTGSGGDHRATTPPTPQVGGRHGQGTEPKSEALYSDTALYSRPAPGTST